MVPMPSTPNGVAFVTFHPALPLKFPQDNVSLFSLKHIGTKTYEEFEEFVDALDNISASSSLVVHVLLPHVLLQAQSREH